MGRTEKESVLGQVAGLCRGVLELQLLGLCGTQGAGYRLGLLLDSLEDSVEDGD